MAPLKHILLYHTIYIYNLFILIGRAYQGKYIVFRFTIEYGSYNLMFFTRGQSLFRKLMNVLFSIP
jgi:hypothetical protein